MFHGNFHTPRPASDRGFTLLETIVALLVLTVGVVATAFVAARSLSTSRQSKFMALATELASEKLEDLSRWDFNDPNVCVQSGDTSEGSITPPPAAPAPLKSITCPGGATAMSVAYYDLVSVDTPIGTTDCSNPTYGCFSEAVYGTDGTLNGENGYTVTSHSPDGTVTVTPPSGTAPSIPVTFDRRWLIEASPVVNGLTITGARRVTVLVTLLDTSLYQATSVYVPVTFQMSIVRP
jgi:prepilin-type N-terminal cleavage/methylation domain-containing protein